MGRSMFVTTRTLSDLTPGKWYFGTMCKGCGERVGIFEDTQGGDRAFDVGETLLRTSCPHCRADGHLYRSEEVQSFQHSSDA